MGTPVWVPARPNEPAHWKVRVSMRGGRPWFHAPAGKSKEGALDWAAAQVEKAEAKGGVFVPTRGPKAVAKPDVPTVAALAESWLKLVDADPELAPATKSMHRGNAEGRISAGLGKLRPEELSSGVLRRWIRSMRDEGLSASRIRNTFNSLGKMLDCAMAEEWITLAANPCRHPGVRQELPSVDGPETIRVLGKEQVGKLVEAETTPPGRALRYLIAATSGMRDGEIAALRWSSLREEQGILCYDVTKSVALIGGEKAPKTRAGRRLIPVHSLVAARFDRRGEPNEYIFGGDRPRSAEMFREDLKAASLPDTFEGEELQFRDLRHCFSTWLASAGVPEELRDRLMGHAPRSVGLRHYTARDLEQLQTAVETIELSQKLSQPEEKKVVEEQKAEELPGAPETTRTSGQRFRKSEQRFDRIALPPKKETLSRYGLSADGYVALHEAQANACAICRAHSSSTNRLVIDHDHTTGAVRGLLCQPCNVGLGFLRDSAKLCERAAAYIRRPNARNVLVHVDPDVPTEDAKYPTAHASDNSGQLAQPDSAEVAIADGLRGAAEAGDWAAVTEFLRELEARRTARSQSNVVQLMPVRGQR